jgi:hypothetical protein
MAEFRFKKSSAIDPSWPLIDLPDARPYLRGNGPHTYSCTACGNPLLVNVEISLPQNVAIVCGKCRTTLTFDV